MKEVDKDTSLCPNCGLIKNQKESEEDAHQNYIG